MAHIGGSFAPPLSDETLEGYRKLIDAVPERSQLRDALEAVYRCSTAWWEQPESTGDGKPHASGRGTVVALEKPIAEALWEHIPWREELDTFAALFDTISNETEKPLRDCAHHLLWHARELDLDREPITTDKL